MLIIFTVEIKSRSPGNTRVNKVKCSSRFQRLKYETGSHKMRIKADRYNPSALEGKKKQAIEVSSKRGKIQKTVIPERSRESGQQMRYVCNMPWKLM